MPRQMKDSGVEWIGEIPNEWEIKRNKELFFEVNDRCENANDYTLLSVSEYYGIAPKSEKIADGEFETRAESLDGYKICKVDDIVMNIMLAWKRSTGRSAYDGIVSPAYCVYRKRTNIDTKYYHYLFRTDIVADLFKRFSTGIIDSRLRLYPDKFLSLHMVVPPLEEQTRIADFLESKCAYIDSVIEKTKESIEEYKRLKQAIITEAVTKGVRGERPMKDSGIDWIGEIPLGWSIIKITHLFDEKHSYPFGDGDHGLIKTDDYVDEGIPYLRVQNLGWGTDLLLDNVVYITEETNEKIKNSILRPGDILFAKTGATIGKTGIVPDNLTVSNTTSHIGKLSVDKEKYYPRYVFYYLSSFYGYRQFWDIAIQKTTRPELAIDEMRAIKILVPDSYDEQLQIADELDKKCKELDLLLDNKEKYLAELDSLKKSLIYEYVTGKKEVPAS